MSELAAAARAPDYACELIGFRAWHLEVAGQWVRLTSPVMDCLWYPRQWTYAHCRRCEVPPGAGCSCGIYAARDRDHLIRGLARDRYHDDDHHEVVIGEVGLAGRVIPGTKGWKAQRARPVRLWLPYSSWQLVAPLRDAYQVPVGLSNLWRP